MYILLEKGVNHIPCIAEKGGGTPILHNIKVFTHPLPPDSIQHNNF